MYPSDVATKQAIGEAVSSRLAGSAIQPPSFTDRLHDEKARLEARLAQINDVLAKLEANPAVMEVVNAIQKVGYIGG